MNEFLFHYHRVHPTTWAYLSSLMAIAVYFKFSRMWSVRNLDILGLILLAPGLLLVKYGETTGAADVEQAGYIWLFATAGFFLVRMLVDPMMVRRPLLEPNMSVGGLTFVAASLLLFLMANVLTSTLTEGDLAGSKMAQQLRTRQEVHVERNSLASRGPGYPPLFVLPQLITQKIVGEPGFDEPEKALGSHSPQTGSGPTRVHVVTTRAVAILSHLAVVIGMMVIGYRHFDNIKTGVAAATMYLLLPYTAQFTGRVDHVLPAGLLIWAIATYRRPLLSGMFMGLAIGVVYYPAFLLPLWIGFYWQRGFVRFVAGVVITVAVLVGILAMTAADPGVFLDQIKQMFGWRMPLMKNPQGFWQFEPALRMYRIPVMAAFFALCGSLAIWPAQKNLGTLIGCSAAVMLASQFWHAHGGGLFMAWYLPLLIMTIFRPNLEDRVALSVLGEGWFPGRHHKRSGIEQAA
ncbi:MAG: hypothetical protein BMS9Abin04_209 [Planctomycetia bacterium]|nr:MAG: hypothetical protein BMS9Abin04_209 [Planctomycetia bacterium]